MGYIGLSGLPQNPSSQGPPTLSTRSLLSINLWCSRSLRLPNNAKLRYSWRQKLIPQLRNGAALLAGPSLFSVLFVIWCIMLGFFILRRGHVLFDGTYCNMQYSIDNPRYNLIFIDNKYQDQHQCTLLLKEVYYILLKFHRNFKEYLGNYFMEARSKSTIDNNVHYLQAN